MSINPFNNIVSTDPERSEEIAAAITEHYFRLRDEERKVLDRLAAATSVEQIPAAELSTVAELSAALPIFQIVVEQLDDVRGLPADMHTVIDGFVQDRWNKHVRTTPTSESTRLRDNAERDFLRVVSEANRKPTKIPAGLVPRHLRPAS